MREKLKNMMWGEPTGEYIPNTIAEYAIMRNIFETMPEISIAESVTFDGLSNGRRNTEKQASVYDAMMAEIMDERNKTKARRVRKQDNRSRAERLADWNAEKERRKDRRIDAKCKHINKKYGYLCIEQERRISAEKTARADWETEKSQHADAMAEYYDYVDFTEDHWNRFERAWDAGRMSNAEYWRSRANETQKIADALYSGEEYYRRNKSFGVRADIYLRLYKEADKWLQWA